MSEFTKAIDLINYVALKADCKNTPRVSLSFDTSGDRARFEQELKRELEPYQMSWGSQSWDMREFTLRGVKVRVL